MFSAKISFAVTSVRRKNPGNPKQWRYIQAGTISIEMAAYAMRAMHEGASLLTAAGPGGAGKTTLMAALLNLLPLEVPIVTYDDCALRQVK